MKYFILTLFSFLLFTTQAHAWVINADFESGTVNSGEADGNDAFSDAFAKTKYSNTQANTGNQSAVSSINAGEFGFGQWGGAFNFPTKLGEGDEIWYRVFLYYPTGFNFTTDAIGVKTLRIHTQSSAGDNEGYFDMLSKGSSGITVWSELGTGFYGNNPNWKGIGAPITTGSWHSYEQYVKFSSVSGKGIYRIWQDGKLVLEDTKSATLRSASSKSNMAYLWSYWNGGSPKTQSAYVDDVIITNEVPNNKDANGNPFVGIGNAKFLAAPKPPLVSAP